MKPRPGPMIFVGGSAHPSNREQAAFLARECGVPIHEIAATDIAATTRLAIAAVRAQGAVSLVMKTDRIETQRALAAMTAVAREVAVQTFAARIFATGGETAFALCRALGVSTLTFRAEIEAGLSLSSAEGVTGPMFWCVKPGGFGDVHTWWRAFKALQAGYFI